MPRFYCPQPLAAGATIALPEMVAHHARVVRLQPGAPLTLFNGDGGEYTAQLLTVDKKGATANVLAHQPRECELPYAITLAQALPEAAKMDWIIEKAVELGASAIQPLAAQRSVVKLSAERAEKRSAHWQAVIVAAAEQSGRNRLATLAPLASFSNWIAASANTRRLLLSPRATESLTTWAKRTTPQAVTILIGPEGGFSDIEEDQAITAGALPLSMGPRILRCETAGMTAIATLQAIWAE